MKQKIVKLLSLGLCCGLVFGLTACGSTAVESSSSEDASAAEETTAEESTDAELEDYYLTLSDGTQIVLTALSADAASITGYYTCQNDGSYWVFDGDSMAVAYENEDGDIEAYICSMQYYSTPIDEDETANYLCVIFTNTLEGTQSCWYVLEAQDDDGNTAGMVLQDPSDAETVIGLIME